MRRDEQSINASQGKVSDEAILETGDSTLAAAVLARDRKATAEFVSRYADRIYSYIGLRLMPRTDLVEDLVQDVFLAAWQGLSSFRGQSSLESWLLGIARHKIEDYYRMRLRAPHPLEENSVEMDEAALVPEMEEKLDEEKTRQKMRRVLASLPENYRMALVWRYWEKCPTQEMAARTGNTEKSIERLLARARDHFRRMWQDV